MPTFDKTAALDIIRNGTEQEQRRLLDDIEQSLKTKRFGLVWEHGGDGRDAAFPAEEIVTEYAKHIPIPQYKAELSLNPHSGSLSNEERERERERARLS
jgi:hypothetical protein